MNTELLQDTEALAEVMCTANGGTWSSLIDTCSIDIRSALGTKPFWIRLARGVQAALDVQERE